MNKKGYSLVELLAVIVILGVLTTGAIIGYSRYADHSREKAKNILITSSQQAMSEYLMDHPFDDEVELDTLVDQGYLEKPQDPYDSSKVCTGKVFSENVGAATGLDETVYKVILCCSNNHYYTYYSADYSNNPNPGTDYLESNEECQATE